MNNSTRILALLAALTLAAAAHAAPDRFAGSWVLDRERSEGLPPDMDQQMTIAAHEGSIDVTTTIVSDMGDRTIADTYTLDGAEHEFRPQMPNYPDATGRRVAKLTGESELDCADHIHDTKSDTTTEITRHFTLAADGKSLTIVLEAKGPNGNVKNKRVFTRKG